MLLSDEIQLQNYLVFLSEQMSRLPRGWTIRVIFGALAKSQSCSRLHTEVNGLGRRQHIEAWGLLLKANRFFGYLPWLYMIGGL